MTRVLLVEDDADIRDSLALLLGRLGYRVSTAAHGVEALERLRAERPCLVLLDLMMPIMDGWQLRTAMLRDPALADIPVVVLSGIDDLDAAAGALQAAAVMRKPPDLPRIRQLIDDVCSC